MLSKTCGQRLWVDALVICCTVSGEPDHSWGTRSGSSGTRAMSQSRQGQILALLLCDRANELRLEP